MRCSAVVLLVGLSYWRFGEDWAIWWRQIVPVPEGLFVVYAGGWVVALTLNGLYRPRARWSIRREAIDVVRATVVMALVTFSVLFIFECRTSAGCCCSSCSRSRLLRLLPNAPGCAC